MCTMIPNETKDLRHLPCAYCTTNNFLWHLFLNFLMQHPWSDKIRLAIDLEAMGIGGKSGVFQVRFVIIIHLFLQF